MPAAAAVPPALAGRVFRGRDAVARGWLTPRQLQACVWRRLLRGVYADAVLAVNHGLFISAAALVIPPEAAIAGRSAAWLWGADDIVAAQDPVEILVPWAHRFGPVAGLRNAQWVKSRPTTSIATGECGSPDLAEPPRTWRAPRPT